MPDPLVRPARVADAGPSGARAARRLGPVPDPAHPSRQRAGRDITDVMDPAGAGPSRPGGAADRRGPRLRDGRRPDDPVAAAGADTLGYDFLAYHQAAVRLLDGQPLYDMSFATTGGFGLFYYPPTFAPLILPFGLLSATTAVWALDGDPHRGRSRPGSRSCRSRRTVRWWIVLLAGLSWPFAYAVKLGQVGPILFLLFAIGWRWLDDPIRLGASAALGTAIKLQPAIIFVWAVADPPLARPSPSASSSWPCWRSLATLLAGVGRLVGLRDPRPPGRRPDHDAAQLHAGGDRLPARASRPSWRRSSSWRRTVVVVGAVVAAARWATAEASYLVAVIASQLLSPVLWDHYAMILLLPVAYLCAAGRWWALAHPARDGDAAGRHHARRSPIRSASASTLGATLGVGHPGAPGAPSGMTARATHGSIASLLVGLAVVAISAVIYWFVEPRLRRRSRRLLLPRRRVPPRPDVADVPARAVRRDHRSTGAFYVPFAPFPAVALMPRRRRPRARSAPTRSSRGSTPSWRRPVSGCAGCCSAGSASGGWSTGSP